jgi:hypothetical protein
MADYKQYAIRSGRSVVGTRTAVSAREAALDYLRARGCSREEITYYGSDGVAWRGAVYRAEAVPSPDGRALRSQRSASYPPKKAL